MITKNDVMAAIEESLRELNREDNSLFGAEIEKIEIADADMAAEYGPRKLHEVCINHRLAVYLERYLGTSSTVHEPLFFDIEFNKNGCGPKALEGFGVARPDIIVHNRKTGDAKRNLLVVECKKCEQAKSNIDADRTKLRQFLCDGVFSYEFGLQVIYGDGRVDQAKFFRRDDPENPIDIKCDD